MSDQITPLVQRQPEDEEEELLQTKELDGHTPEVTPSVASKIASMQGGGKPLPAAERAFFEPRFERSFSQVRIHTGGQAAEAARSVRARAFTAGRDIVFGPGAYAPESASGRRLLAHELTHVVQQGASQQITSSSAGQTTMQSCRTLMREPTTPSLETREETSLETHQKFLNNFLQPAVNRIGSVKTPYSEALHALYSAGLGQAQSSPLAPKQYAPENYTDEVEVTIGSLRKKILFTLMLYQDPTSSVRAISTAIGDKAFIALNELSDDARHENLPGIEQTMVHEGMHVLSDLVTEANAGAAAGTPANAPNLDLSRYSSQRQAIEKAVLPVITGAFIHEPDGVARHTDEQYKVWAEVTALNFVREAIVRVEAAIYAKLGSNQPFTKDDLPDPDLVMFTKAYWSIEGGDLASSLEAFGAWLDSNVRPQVISVQESYFAMRPEPQPASP